jgi:hypothetical protein
MRLRCDWPLGWSDENSCRIGRYVLLYHPTQPSRDLDSPLRDPFLTLLERATSYLLIAGYPIRLYHPTDMADPQIFPRRNTISYTSSTTMTRHGLLANCSPSNAYYATRPASRDLDLTADNTICLHLHHDYVIPQSSYLAGSP